ncbi:MAG: two-component regulator propeller domain-containing protein [Saprospiraceae bacterium]
MNWKSTIRIAVIGLVLTVKTLAAQSTDYEIRYLGFREGLKDRNVTAVCHDHKGIVWIGTRTGLYRYDGYEITPFSISGTGIQPNFQGIQINYVLEDADRNLWVAAMGKTFVLSPNLQLLVTAEYFQSLITDDKKQVFGSENSKVSHLQLVHEEGAVKVVKKWTPLKGNYLFRKTGDSNLWSYDCFSGKVRILEENHQVREVTQRLRSDLWICYLNYEGGAFITYPHNNAFLVGEQPPFLQPLPETTRDLKNPYFFKTLLNDFIRQNTSLFSPEIAGLINLPNAVEPDRYGNLWVGTEFGVFLVMKRGAGFQFIEVLRGEPARAMFKNVDTLMVSVPAGLQLINLKTGASLGKPDFIGTTRVILPVGEKKLLLAGEFDHLYIVDKGSGKVLKEFGHNQIFHQFSGVKLPNGQFWIGGPASGMLQIDPMNYERPVVLGLGQNYARIRAVVAGQDNEIWAGGEGGLFRVKDYKLSNNLLPANKTDLLITCMLKMGDTLWLGTRAHGLFLFDVKKLAFIHELSTVDGLPNHVINALLADRDNYIWISTNQGLSQLNPQTGELVNFSARDGLQIEEFNMSSASFDPASGLMFFGGLNGVTWFDPSKIEKNIIVPEVFFSKILRSGQVDGDIETLYPDMEAPVIKLEANARFVEFHLGSTDYAAPQQNSFWHKLKGFDADWVSGHNNPVIQYSSLPAGDYTLCVRTVNREGYTSPEKCIGLYVKQVFYKTWWFRGLIALLLGAMALIYYLDKIRQVNQIIHIKKQIADDLHDDVAASLSQISMLAKSSLQESESGNTTLTQIESLSDESIGKLSDIVWAIDDRPQTLEALANRLQDHAESVFYPLQIRMKAEIHIAESVRNITSPVRHHVLMIFKEAVNNIVRHSNSNFVFIRLENQRKELVLVIENSFNVLKSGAHSSGKGLDSMAKRARLLNGDLKIEKTDRSFRLILQVPDIFGKTSL